MPTGRVKIDRVGVKVPETKAYPISEYQLMTTQKYDDMIARDSKMADRWIDSIEN